MFSTNTQYTLNPLNPWQSSKILTGFSIFSTIYVWICLVQNEKTIWMRCSQVKPNQNNGHKYRKTLWRIDEVYDRPKYVRAYCNTRMMEIAAVLIANHFITIHELVYSFVCSVGRLNEQKYTVCACLCVCAVQWIDCLMCTHTHTLSPEKMSPAMCVHLLFNLKIMSYISHTHCLQVAQSFGRSFVDSDLTISFTCSP